MASTFRKSKNPVIRLTAKEWADFRQDIIDYIKERYPAWTDFLPSDLGMALVETAAGLTDYLAYYQNVTANESFLKTAQFRKSLFKLAKMFGYVPKRPSAAMTTLRFVKETADLPATIPAGTMVSTANKAVVFTTLEDLTIPVGQSEGTVGAVHGQKITGEIIGVSDGSPYQRFALGNLPLSLFADGANSLKVFVDGVEWAETPSFIRSWNEQVWRMEVDPGAVASEDVAVVCFGDGVFGLIPENGATITADYLVGGGRDGNVGQDTLTRLIANIPNVLSVTNTTAAAGGEDAESDEDIRQNVPVYVYSRRRMVTQPDYQRLLQQLRELSRVHVVHPHSNRIEIYAFASGGEFVSETLKAKMEELIAAHKIIDDDVVILDPVLLPLDVTAEIELISGVNAGEAMLAIESDLRDFIDQREFGRSILVQDAYRFFTEHPQVERATITHFALHPSPTGTVHNIVVSGGQVAIPGTITLIEA